MRKTQERGSSRDLILGQQGLVCFVTLCARVHAVMSVCACVPDGATQAAYSHTRVHVTKHACVHSCVHVCTSCARLSFWVTVLSVCM